MGTVVVSGAKRGNLLGVSADGILHCMYDGINCPYNDGICDHTKKISLEIKCPFNLDNPYMDPFYTLPQMYVPQITSQMFAFNSEFGILATKTDNSVIFKRITNDEETWNQQSEILVDFYDNDIIKKPSKFHPRRKEVRSKIGFFSEYNCTVLMEVPEMSGFDSCTSNRQSNSPFRERNNCPENIFQLELFCQELSVTLAESLSVINDAHNICRKKSSEILLFMLSDSDRMKFINDDTYTHVIGYGMKGYSLPVNTLCEMVEFLRNILQDYKIPVLCESFDGQWANLAFKDSNGEPLTLYHLLSKSWEQAHNLSRRSILLKLRNISTIQCADLVTVTQGLTRGKMSVESGNLTASIQFNGNGRPFLSIGSKGGDLHEEMLLCHASLAKVKNINDSSVQLHDAELKMKKKLKGIHTEDLDIVSTFEPSLVRDIISDLENDPNNTGIQLQDFLYSPRLQLLTKILCALQINGNHSDWKTFTEDDLFPGILMSKETLLLYSRHDIDEIVKIINENTARRIFAAKDTKDIRAAKIAFLFGSGKLVYSTPKQVPSLKIIAQNRVEEFPLLVLQSAYAGLIHVKNRREFGRRKTINMEAYVPIVGDFVPLFIFS